MSDKPTVAGAAAGHSAKWGSIEPVERLADRLYDRLFSLIESGEFAEGTQLPTEYELAAQFNVSRPLIREVLIRLREKGIIVSRRGVGSFVCSIPAKGLQPDASIAGFLPISSLADVQKCYDFRIAIEGEAAFFAARNRSEENLKELRSALNELEEIISAGKLGTDADYNFHAIVAGCSKNPFFAQTMIMMRSSIRFAINLSRKLSLTHPADRLRIVQAEHIEIFDTIAAGDSEGARQAMRRHLANACSRIFDGPN
jgi:DNA-binding FadR family transcriptional regulator